MNDNRHGTGEPSDPALTALRDHYDVVIVGAGPSGMAAASLCARARLATVVLDDQDAPGGQAYRGITRARPTERRVLGDDYWRGEKLVREFEASGAEFVGHARVESVTADHDIAISLAEGSRTLQATHVILATGALERPVPIPGGSLPGVMMAGAAQWALVDAGVAPEGRTVLAGTGPLLWLVAWRLLQAGRKVDAMLDTTPAESRAAAWPHLPGFLFSPYFFRGVELVTAVQRRVQVVKDVVELAALGDARVSEVRYRTAGGRQASLPADTLWLHEGVVPNSALAASVGVEHRWDAMQLCRTPVTKAFGATSVPGYYAVGDAAGIAGAQAAAWRGVLAAADIVHTVAPAAAAKAASLARSALRGYTRGRRFLDLRFRPRNRGQTTFSE